MPKRETRDGEDTGQTEAALFQKTTIRNLPKVDKFRSFNDLLKAYEGVWQSLVEESQDSGADAIVVRDTLNGVRAALVDKAKYNRALEVVDTPLKSVTHAQVQGAASVGTGSPFPTKSI